MTEICGCPDGTPSVRLPSAIADSTTPEQMRRNERGFRLEYHLTQCLVCGQNRAEAPTDWVTPEFPPEPGVRIHPDGSIEGFFPHQASDTLARYPSNDGGQTFAEQPAKVMERHIRRWCGWRGLWWRLRHRRMFTTVSVETHRPDR